MTRNQSNTVYLKSLASPGEQYSLTMAFLLCVFVALYIAQSAEEDRVGIVGGTDAAPHSRPYMVSLQVGKSHLCGGILVREDFVLTAAHCNGFRRYRVVLGAHSLNSRESTQQALYIKRFYPHPKYNLEANDIMLLKLNGKAKLTKFVQVIPLMTQRLPPGKVCSTAGWGDVGDNGTLPNKLQEVNTTIIGQKKCAKLWRGSVKITKRMVCATGQRQFQGFCSGDSGGPLVCDGKAAGSVSFSGQRCGDSRTPDVYMNIPSYRRWIKYVLKRG
ncbi:mast cell protease 1A-like isoform X2 [Conger conger]|uniref:mast cell protease 1A-like isoform X2 n=1 Tax=Conger conger TaxID=82655 RepID=UPI002A5A36A0|nr:mast cell protease 1A-like isoform X2 [Conger conger]